MDPAVPGTSVYGSDTFEDEGAFLDARVALYLRLVFTIIAGLYVGGWILLAIADVDAVAIHLGPSKIAHLAMAVALGITWRWVAAERRSPAVLHGVELAATFGVAGNIAVASFVVPDIVPSTVMITIAIVMVSLLLVLRAALVPGSARRAALTGAACTVVVATTGALNFDGASMPGIPAPVAGALMPAVGLTIFTVASTVVADTIYGLQASMRKAMQLGQYTLLEKIGEGGMGAVYRAQHALLRRPTAVKLLPREKVGEASIARFEREVQLTSLLTHPNTVSIYDYGRTRDGVFYYAMEFLEGVSLEQLVELDGPQPPARVVAMLEQVSSALSEAHRAGLIHRDIKPANILLCQRGGLSDVAKVLDFGLVKDVQAPEALQLTAANVVTGTPHYLAPEVLTHPDDIDARVDIYALGAVAYFLLAGQPVFDGQTLVEICGHHLHTEPSSFADQGIDVPREVEEIVMRCLAKEPDDRFEDAAALHDALRRCSLHGAWSHEDAEEWWRSRKVELAALRPTAESDETDDAMPVALSRRLA
jgi:serine/threonine-protein kinase